MARPHGALPLVLALLSGCASGRVDNAPRNEESTAGALPEPGRLPPRRYGDVMNEIGRRFERSGRSVAAEQWDLARYDLLQLEELFESDVPAATPPADVGDALGDDAHAFARSLPEAMRSAVEAHDKEAFARTYAHAADACNGCHRAARRDFIEIPRNPMQPVPVVRAPAQTED